MNWDKVRLIFAREVRDQLRDRRTLFTIAVLPVLLYPLLGMTMLNLSQSLREQPSKVRLVGAGELPGTPRLLDKQEAAFAPELCDERLAKGLALTVEASSPGQTDMKAFLAGATEQIRQGEFDAIVLIPAGFSERLTQFRQAALQRREAESDPAAVTSSDVPSPDIFCSTAKDKSNVARQRLADVLRNWRESVVEACLREGQIPKELTRPFDIATTDVSEELSRRAAVWSKILPFVALIWALTGAFYPAVDLCAGEKERGTLETLLCSPAERNEIVWGKLLTIMLFSITTALLNLFSMSFTGAFIVRQMAQLDMPLGFGTPPLAATLWLVVALIPISLLFSALALAIAAFARSSKEGQYYLMPMLLISLPLMILAILPAAKLDWGSALIPVTGIMLLLRALVEGQYVDAARYSLPAVGVTIAGAMLAIRWAIEQFNDESVLFRESERGGLRIWIRHLVRERGSLPTLGEALACGMLLLVIRFFASFTMGTPSNWPELASSALTIQLALIATPALLMAVMLTRSPRRALGLNWPPAASVPAAVLLAMALHPLSTYLGHLIQQVYPLSPDAERFVSELTTLLQAAPLPYVLLVMALAPAICEELAFRGFILSGTRRLGHKWWSIAITAALFGITHSILQQSLNACVLGLVIGYIAVQSGSILPAIAFHATHNGLAMLKLHLSPDQAAAGVLHDWPVTTLATLAAAALLYYFHRLQYQPSEEESLQRAMRRQSAVHV